MAENYFPQGIASGEAFLGRTTEMDALTDNIEQGHHTLLLAPRRFGKTSLALAILKKLDIPYAELNLFLALTGRAVEKKMVAAVQEILSTVSSKPEKLLRVVSDFLKKTKVNLSLTVKGVFNIQLGVDGARDAEIADTVLVALQLAEHVLREHNKRAVLFIDEIQEIDELEEGRQIEGAIREFAQKSKRLVIIFSGSNRRMLLHLFDDHAMPLYELCERITLERVVPEAYQTYLNKIAKKTWGEPLPTETFNEIMALSQRHPRRVYNLCWQLWRRHEHKKHVPSAQDVQTAWESYVQQRLKDVRYNLSKLNRSQLKVLTLLAIDTAEVTGKTAQHRLDLASSTITQALIALEEGDYVERLGKGDYRIIDPLIQSVLANYERENLND